MISPQVIDLLGLSKNEVKVSGFLKKEPSRVVADIAETTKIPRMTVYLTLNSLKKRGLVDFHRKGKRRFWSAIDDKELVHKVTDIISSITGTSEVRVNVNDSGFAILYGKEAPFTPWEALKDLPPYTRIYLIQPTAAIKYPFERMGWRKDVVSLQENILQKPIIIDGVLPEDYYPFFVNHFAGDKKLQRSILESFVGRVTDMTFVSKEYFKNTESELIILPNVAYLTDWKNEISIEIRNPIMLNFLKELYELAKGYGKKVDQNTYIKGLIEGLDKGSN